MPINYDDYHPKWRLISKLIRFKRAGNRCEWCQAENYKLHPVTRSKVILTVAHLDRNIANNRFWNLAALCQRCHLNHDRAANNHIKKFGKKYLLDQLQLMI